MDAETKMCIQKLQHIVQKQNKTLVALTELFKEALWNPEERDMAKGKYDELKVAEFDIKADIDRLDKIVTKETL